MSQLWIRLINVGLRGTTLVSKFLLIFLLARFLEPSELGLYGLVTVTISYALYFLGFDFYIFTTREILKAPPEKRGQLLKSQLGLSAILYAVFLPLSLCLFALGLLPWWLWPWFIALMILEHITQELNRLLVALSRQLVASWVLFFRAGAWCLAVVVLMFFDESQRNLQTVFSGWILGSATGFLIGVVVLVRARMGGWNKAIDWSWLKKGLRVALPMLVATLAIRGVFTVDRYWFETAAGMEVLGAYVLFMGMTGALQSFISAGVFTFLYPAMISAHANQDASAFRAKYRQLALQTLVLVVVFSVVAWIVVGPLLEWVGRPLYMQYQYLFGWLLLANAIFVVSMVPHYGLYARGKDKPLVISHLAGFIVFVCATAGFSRFATELAVPYGLITAFSFILGWKALCFYQLTPRNWR